MYDLPHHKARNEQDIKEFIDQHPFAFLTGVDSSNQPVATQVPVFIEEHDGRKILRGHFMKHTDHHKAFLYNPHVLAVFTGRHTYVSGTWYSNPYTPSTWNYMSVHVSGMMKILDDSALISILQKTTLHFENQNPHSTTIFDNMPIEYMQRLMKAIVAFEVEVTKMESVFKLSQDRDEQSYHNIIGKLREQGEDGRVIADEMVKRKQDVFPL